MIDESKKLLLESLRCAVRGQALPASEAWEQNRWDLYQLASEHQVLPLVADAIHKDSCDAQTKLIENEAKRLTIRQAQHTADFVLLLQSLERNGLRPVIVKGIVCRSLYPEPELRPSVDEDLLIRPEEYDAYDAVLTEVGFKKDRAGENTEVNYEIAFMHPDSHLCVELHTSLFPIDSVAYGSCARYFVGALDHTIELKLRDISVRTLAPTEHLLFLICHAYKHLLHGGVGIRQLCDMGLMAEKDSAKIDWAHIRLACDELGISVFTAAMFRICEKHLGFAVPAAFAEVEVDETDLLEDVLSGGLYGVVDVDRAHSSTMTLEAVSADRSGRRARGALHSVFLPLESMRGQYPYLRKNPWLLPVAWSQRIFRYLTRKNCADPIDPTRSIQIARDRIELLKEYQIIR